jgi:hypothetical protein
MNPWLPARGLIRGPAHALESAAFYEDDRVTASLVCGAYGWANGAPTSDALECLAEEGDVGALGGCDGLARLSRAGLAAELEDDVALEDEQGSEER